MDQTQNDLQAASVRMTFTIICLLHSQYSFFILDTSKQVLWQTAKTQMDATGGGILSGYALFAKMRQRYTIL